MNKENEFTSVSTIGLRAVLVGLASTECNVSEILKNVDIERKVIDDPEGKVSIEQLNNFWKVSSDQLQDSHLGLNMSLLVPFGTYQICDFLFSSSPNIEEGLMRFQRYYSLVHQELKVGIEYEGSNVKVSINSISDTILNYNLIEYEVGILYNRLNHVIKKDFPIEYVTFCHSDPDSSFDCTKVFKAGVYFEKDKCTLVFNKELLKINCLDSDSNLSIMLEETASNLMEKLPTLKLNKDPFLDKFNKVLQEKLNGGTGTLEDAAKGLGMSGRSLQRKLKSMDLSFSSAVSELRYELSMGLLMDKRLSLAEISFMVGFSEPSAFHRAFKKWSGQTPLQYRQTI